MATRKAEKKRKNARPPRTPLGRKKTGKPSKPKLQEKKPEKKKTKKAIVASKKAMKIKAPVKEPAPPMDLNEAARKILWEMHEKLMADISEKPIPETLLATSDIGDIVDQAGDERERELSLLLTGRDKEKLQAINEALEKVKDGTYGICEECGEKIGQGRLKVMPLARFCVSCQSKLEKEMTLQRKAEEDLQYRGLTAYSPGAEEEEA